MEVKFSPGQHALPPWGKRLNGPRVTGSPLGAAGLPVQQISTSAQNAQAASNTSSSYGLPHANVTLNTTPITAQAGQPLTLTLDVSDGATGLPVDDLAPHHDALMHLIVIDADGSFFTH